MVKKVMEKIVWENKWIIKKSSFSRNLECWKHNRSVILLWNFRDELFVLFVEPGTWSVRIGMQLSCSLYPVVLRPVLKFLNVLHVGTGLVGLIDIGPDLLSGRLAQLILNSLVLLLFSHTFASNLNFYSFLLSRARSRTRLFELSETLLQR